MPTGSGGSIGGGSGSRGGTLGGGSSGNRGGSGIVINEPSDGASAGSSIADPGTSGAGESTGIVGGSTLGAALLNLDTQESAPGGAGGLDLYARQQREINRLKSRVAVVEQVLVV
jgi:hypothetical protein